MTFTELFGRIGDDKLLVQALAPCITNARSRKNGATELSFITDQMTPGDLLGESRMVGIVVWVKREDFEAAHAKAAPR